MVKKVKNYTPEFKQQAINLALKFPSIAHTARELGLPAATLHTWLHTLKKKGSLTQVDVDSSKDMAAIIEENRRLHKELARVQEEKEILKKAAA